jgi:DNA transposition AAA+ family ATPase
MQPNFFLPLKNVMLFQELVEQVCSRSSHLPGMACFYGPSGYGKTKSATYGANHSSAFYIELNDTCTRKSMCQMILIEVGLPDLARKASVPDMVNAIQARLAETGDRPLIIDEADFLLKKNLIDTVRALHDKSGAPVILIGEELLPQKLKAHERAHNRMLNWVAAQPCDLDDTALIAERLGLASQAGGVKIGKDLVAAIHKASGGRIRRVLVNVEQIVNFARATSKSQIDLAAWGARPLSTGEPPSRRAA